MKPLKPGQFVNVNGILCRIHKRTIGCKGCMFNNPFSCPRKSDNRYSHERIECMENGVIFKRL